MGKHPIWNETFELMVDSMDHEIEFKLKDANIISDDFIAATFIKVS